MRKPSSFPVPLAKTGGRPESSQIKNPRMAGQAFGFVRYAELLNHWIPACAGMTK